MVHDMPAPAAVNHLPSQEIARQETAQAIVPSRQPYLSPPPTRPSYSAVVQVTVAVSQRLSATYQGKRPIEITQGCRGGDTAVDMLVAEPSSQPRFGGGSLFGCGLGRQIEGSRGYMGEDRRRR